MYIYMYIYIYTYIYIYIYICIYVYIYIYTCVVLQSVLEHKQRLSHGYMLVQLRSVAECCSVL